MSYKIGSLNMKNLGLTALQNDNGRDLKKIAEIIRGEKFDVVALQEVLSEGKAFNHPDSAKKSILMELGSDWGFEWADAKSPFDNRGEGYAFVWNKRRLRLATTELENHTFRTFYPRMYRLNKREMFRRPYYARFTPEGTLGGTYFEIRLICVHTLYGNDTAEDRMKRQHELDVLMKDIYPQISDKVYKGNMPHCTILLGDYNVELSRPWKDKMRKEQNVELISQGKSPRPSPAYLIADKNDIVEVAKWGNRQIKTVQDEFTTLKAKSSYENGVRGYSHDYDHFSYEVSQFEGITMKAKRVDAVRKYCNDDFEQYLKTVSDHIPIMMELELK